MPETAGAVLTPTYFNLNILNEINTHMYKDIPIILWCMQALNCRS